MSICTDLKKIRIFGVYGSFGYRQIGGTDSFFRRFCSELAKRGLRVEFILYDSPTINIEEPEPFFTVRSVACFNDALDYLAKEDGPVLVNAVCGKDRLRFIKFRHDTKRSICWVMVYSLLSELWWPRFKHFIEARLYAYNGGSLCMSERLMHYVSHFDKNARALIPPVDKLFFRSPEEKMIDGEIHVTYIGRLEEGKGAGEALQILKGLSIDSRFKMKAVVYAFDGDVDADAYDYDFRTINGLDYSRRDHSGWEPMNDQILANVLAQTDVLLLPYRRISSSIDTPLLLLEGMASLCCCICPPLGDIPKITGLNPYLIASENFTQNALVLLHKLDHADIKLEQKRLFKRCKELAFGTESATDQLLSILKREV